MTTATHTPSRACYQRGCQRDECKQANYRYMSRIRLDHARGQRRRTNATQTRHHIERLIAAGWTQAQIARVARLAHRTVGAVVAGCPTVANATALAILTIPLGPAPTDTRDVDATGTIRRIRALVAIGWPVAQLAHRFGLYPTALGNIARGQLQHVRATTADTIALEYRELCRTPGPSQRARNEARKKGWHGPLAWDDIDDPAAQPERFEEYQPVAANGRDSMRKAEIEHLYLLGESVEQIAKKFDGNEKYTADQLGAVLRERAKRGAQEQKELAA